jgi:alkylhydroperoxidase family enzyme
MARVSLDPPRSLTIRIGEWYSRRRFGAVLDPGRVMAHNPRVLKTYVREELSAEKWKRVPSGLKSLAAMSAAATVGCAWCMDFGYWQSTIGGADPAKIRDIRQWRESTAYTEPERAVIEYAEAMSVTPPMVEDSHVVRLRAFLDEAQVVELTMTIAIENQRSRFNAALGLSSQRLCRPVRAQASAVMQERMRCSSALCSCPPRCPCPGTCPPG